VKEALGVLFEAGVCRCAQNTAIQGKAERNILYSVGGAQGYAKLPR
jgi:hypothetical protein